MMLNERKLGNRCNTISKVSTSALTIRESDHYLEATLSKEIREASHCNFKYFEAILQSTRVHSYFKKVKK